MAVTNTALSPLPAGAGNGTELPAEQYPATTQSQATPERHVMTGDSKRENNRKSDEKNSNVTAKTSRPAGNVAELKTAKAMLRPVSDPQRYRMFVDHGRLNLLTVV